jgi:hypothetical protein
MLLFHIFNTETIDQSIVSYYLTGNVTLFRRILMPCPDWINVLYLFGTLGLHRLLAKTLEIFLKFQKFQKKFKMFTRFQNFHKISKFSKNFKNFSFHKISKIFKEFQNSKKKIHNFKIFIRF